MYIHARRYSDWCTVLHTAASGKGDTFHPYAVGELAWAAIIYLKLLSQSFQDSSTGGDGKYEDKFRRYVQ